MRRRSSILSQADWGDYKNIVNNFIDNDSGKQPFMWLRKIDQMLPFGEDSGTLYQPIHLEGLFQYNYIKTWPSNVLTISGDLSDIDIVLYISARVLGGNGYLSDLGYWDFNWAEDRFYLNGRIYKPSGDTQTAQAGNEALLFFVVLKREPGTETKNLINAYVTGQTQVANSRGVWLFDNQSNARVSDILGMSYSLDREPDIPIKTKDGVIIGFNQK